MAVPDVKPLMVSVSSDGIVRLCRDETVQVCAGGIAAVVVIEQVCAAAIRALIITAQAAAPARDNFRINNSV
jgi:hypothetical protein